MSGLLQRWVVQPISRTATKIETRSAVKLATRSNPEVAALVKEAEATGADAASISTKRFLCEQSQLMSYRVVRTIEEGRYLLSGQHCKNYDMGKFLHDARWATEALFIFIMAVIVGRRSIYPPIAPESPLAIALEHKVNPNY